MFHIQCNTSQQAALQAQYKYYRVLAIQFPEGREGVSLETLSR